MAFTIKKQKLTLKRDAEAAEGEAAPESGTAPDAGAAVATAPAAAAPAETPARAGIPFLVTGILALVALAVMVALLFVQMTENSFY